MFMYEKKGRLIRRRGRMLIYSKQSQENMIGPLVPKRVKKPSNADLKSEFNSNQRVVGIMLLPFSGVESGSSNKWTATTTTTRNRAKNVNLVTETLNLITILLLVSLYNLTIVDCQWPSEKVHHQGVSALNSASKSPEARKVIGGGGGSTGNGISTTGSSASYGNRISQMFASLGPRRDTPGQIAAQETIPSASFQLFDPAPSSASSRNSAAAANSQQLIGSEAHKGPPVYRSAPKQIIEIHEEPTKMKKRSSSKPSMIEVEISPKKIEKPKVLKVKKIKKKTKKKHSKKNVAASMVGPFHHKKGKKHNYPSHYTYLGKYHEHRSVPSKGVWEFGYKRGNSKHTIEREEHGQKSHFKTEVKWKDKKGKGHHVFDYNHGDHKKKQHNHHAAASQVTQKKEEPAIAAGLTLATKKKST